MEPIEFRDPRQERIERLLHDLIGPGVAAFFRDACRMMTATDRLECTSHFVGHAVREIESAIRDVVLPAPEAKQKRRAGSNHRTEIVDALNELGIPKDRPVWELWLRLSEPDQGLARLAHRDSLRPTRGLDHGFETFWDSMLQLFDTVLRAFESRYAGVYERIDDLAERDALHPSDGDWIALHVPHNHHVLTYLFDKLSGPAWLPVLRQAGLFDRPPAADHNEETDTHSLRLWPASQHLARMVALAPDDVADIAERIETDNPTIVADLMKVACQLPVERAVRFVRKCESWRQLPEWPGLPEAMARLVAHLANHGKAEAAFVLAETLLAPDADPRRGETRESGPFREPHYSMKEYEYEHALASCVDALFGLDAVRLFEMLVGLLDDACRCGQMDDADDAFEDLSYVHRPAIEDHEQNRTGWGVTGHLVTALRDVAEKLVREAPERVRDVVGRLRERPQGLFQRIALHIVRLHAGNDCELAAEWLCDRRMLFGVTTHHEYAILARDHFGALSPENQKTVLSLVAEGPNLSHWLARAEREQGGLPSADDERVLVEHWQLRRLAPFRDALPQEWRVRFAELVSKHGEPEFPDFMSWSSGIVEGPQSPFGPADLAALSIPDLVHLLNRWEAPGGFMGPTPEGLGRTLTSVVTSDPGAHAEQAMMFCALDEPTYASGVLWGFYDALRQGRTFAWQQVIELCQETVRRPRDIPGRDPDSWECDPHWGWARRHVAALLEQGLKTGDAQIPIEHRAVVWRILRTLADDPDPTPEHEAMYGGDNMDPVTMSLNTVRGRTMHAALAYAMWVHRSCGQASDVGGSSRADIMPEFWELLDEKLAPASEPSAAVRAMIGLHLSNLLCLNRELTLARIPRIFPTDPSDAYLWEAAWLGYLCSTPAYGDLLAPMQEVYSHALDRVGTDRPKSHACSVDERLGEHLLAFYWRGMLSLEDPDSLLVRFFNRAPLDLRRTTLGYVGRVLCPSGDRFSADQLDRLKALFEWRASVIEGNADTASEAAEFADFGYWFGSGRLDDEWSLHRLAKVLRLFNRVGPPHMVLERLAVLAQYHPQVCVECLDALVDGLDPLWLHWEPGNDVCRIISRAHASGNPQARDLAQRVVNRLTARGLQEYRVRLNHP